MDVKAGPQAQAPLAFEFSDEAQRLIVNCGYPRHLRADWVEACSLPEAHSTAVAYVPGHTPSAGLKQWLSALWPLRRASEVNAAETKMHAEGGMVRGAATLQGAVRHERDLFLAASGFDLRGEDRFLFAQPVAAPEAEIAHEIRFHLHPGVKAEQAQDGAAISLVLPNMAVWHFSVRGGEASLEQSIYLPGTGDPRNSQQIVIRGRRTSGAKVMWAFKSVTRPPRGERAPEA
jgi:uncharacterized heparinase superfamily protein